MPDRNRVDHFVIVGAQRCGTTYLYQLLDEHPEIEMAKPLRPEPKFFLDDEHYPLGLAYYDSTFFSNPRARVRGEKSTSYIESDVAIARIQATLPESTLVVVLRDPVWRAISNYRFSVQYGVEDLGMSDAMRVSANERAWDSSRFSVSPFAYLARGRYADYLEPLAVNTESERVSVLLFEELVTGTAAIAGLFERLGVDPSFEPAGLGAVVNASAPGDHHVDRELEQWLRDYFRGPNERLETLLGRQLPWPA
jgi:hypothetical protein